MHGARGSPGSSSAHRSTGQKFQMNAPGAASTKDSASPSRPGQLYASPQGSRTSSPGVTSASGFLAFMGYSLPPSCTPLTSCTSFLSEDGLWEKEPGPSGGKTRSLVLDLVGLRCPPDALPRQGADRKSGAQLGVRCDPLRTHSLAFGSDGGGLGQTRTERRAIPSDSCRGRQ